MSLFAPGFEERVGEVLGDWHPARFTPSLSGGEEFPTEGDKLLTFAGRYWTIPEVSGPLALDDWQRWLVRHVLEVYPEDWPVEHLRGQLRFRQVVISMGRQNGKSLLGALFVIYFLALHVRGPRVIGLASVDRQAKIVYDRVRYGIDNNHALGREIRTTGTRGITRRDGSGLYQTLPAREDSAQGEPASGVIYDELHLGLAALWDAMVLAQRARRNSLIVGITTAGDDDSHLLIRLYREGEAAIRGDDERFGFFCWEAPDDQLTEANVLAANPAIACGRVPLDVAMSDAAKMMGDHTRGPDGLTGPQRVTRYTLNRFIEGSADAWASVTAWQDSTGDVDHGEALTVYGIDRTTDWEYATITATSQQGATFSTEVVATLTDPTFDRLLDACLALATRGGRRAYAMPADTLARLAERLREEGEEAWKLASTEMASAAQHGKALIGRRQITHHGHPLMRLQMARARPRATSDGWKLSRSLSTGDIDAVLATLAGLYVATIREDDGGAVPIF